MLQGVGCCEPVAQEEPDGHAAHSSASAAQCGTSGTTFATPPKTADPDAEEGAGVGSGALPPVAEAAPERAGRGRPARGGPGAERPVEVRRVGTQTWTRYGSIATAARTLNVCASSLSRFLRGEQQSLRGGKLEARWAGAPWADGAVRASGAAARSRFRLASASSFHADLYRQLLYALRRAHGSTTEVAAAQWLAFGRSLKAHLRI